MKYLQGLSSQSSHQKAPRILESAHSQGFLLPSAVQPGFPGASNSREQQLSCCFILVSVA